MKKTDIGVVAFMYAICALFLTMTISLKPAAQTYPLFVIGLLFILTTLYVFQMIRQFRREGGASGISESFAGFLPKQFFPVFVMTACYMVLMYLAGFYIATVIYMAVCLLFLKVPKIQTVLSVVVIVLLVYLAFTKFLGVRLPEGLFFQ